MMIITINKGNDSRISTHIKTIVIMVTIGCDEHRGSGDSNRTYNNMMMTVVLRLKERNRLAMVRTAVAIPCLFTWK